MYVFISWHTLTWKHKHYPIKEDVEPLCIPEELEFMGVDSLPTMYGSQQSLIPKVSASVFLTQLTNIYPCTYHLHVPSIYIHIPYLYTNAYHLSIYPCTIYMYLYPYTISVHQCIPSIYIHIPYLYTNASIYIHSIYLYFTGHTIYLYIHSIYLSITHSIYTSFVIYSY